MLAALLLVLPPKAISEDDICSHFYNQNKQLRDTSRNSYSLFIIYLAQTKNEFSKNDQVVIRKPIFWLTFVTLLFC